ncbi:hypothetical protein QYM36_012171 [Artemia franciscana]|uniref:Uncharacterized protein n=1 Tax=Artemia franciscana TaxID=6661 RepID=A0AA88L2L5_ARTSF|nr:hypothetical protein QYM36_012171 [Artemia franciscana]
MGCQWKCPMCKGNTQASNVNASEIARVVDASIKNSLSGFQNAVKTLDVKIKEAVKDSFASFKDEIKAEIDTQFKAIEDRIHTLEQSSGMAKDNNTLKDLVTTQVVTLKKTLDEQFEIRVKAMIAEDPDDGQNIYLHDVCSQMLKHEYGSLQTAPRVLSGKIIQQETYSMTPELRSHLRYLKHLPVPTVFVVIKVELDDCVISQETFDHFRDRFPEREERLRSKDHVEIKPLGSSLHFPSCSRDELRHGDEPGHSQPQESEEVQFLPSHRWQREPSPAWQLQPLDLLGEVREVPAIDESVHATVVSKVN